MKKFIGIGFIVVMTFMLSSFAVAAPKDTPPGQQNTPPGQLNNQNTPPGQQNTPPGRQEIVISGTIINACYQKIDGQLRVVSDPSQCRPSELPITLSAPPQPKTVFITSLTYDGTQIGGIAGADAQCNALAAAAVPALPGTYKAWISDDSVGPATTFTRYTGPYVNTAGDVIANDWVGLTSGVLFNSIRYSESGADLTPASGGPIDVWTGTDTSGNPVVGQTCTGWTAAGSGIEGYGNSPDADWTLGPSLDCAQQAHLYCIEQ
jgi:hypothetical protein